MEVLRATEILENEINENVKKEAACILAEAESECRKIAENVDNRIATMEQEQNLSLQKQLATIKMGMEAAVSLSKVRFLVEYTDKTVLSAINNYLNALDETKQLELVSRQLEKYRHVLEGKRLIVSIIGFEEKSVQSVLASTLGKNAIVSCQLVDPDLSVDADLWSLPGLEVRKGVIVEAEDGSVRCRATIAEIVRELLADHGDELVRTLFCGGLPQ